MLPFRDASLSRRDWFSWAGSGLGGVALAGLLQRDGVASAATNHAAKAKRVVHIRLCGGMSHLDSFDYKPMLAKLHGKRMPADAKPETFFGQVGLLRPLLVVPPAALRELLRGIGWSWVEDPSNRDLRWHRAVLRGLRRDSDGRGPATRSLVAAATRRQLDRAARARATAEELAAKVAFHPEGFAIMASGPIGVPALQAVLRVIGGRGYAVSASRVTSLANDPRPATIGGVRLLPAGRLGPAGSLLAVRELATISEAASVRRDLPFAVRRALQSAAFEPAAPAT